VPFYGKNIEGPIQSIILGVPGKLLAGCYRKSLELAVLNNVKSIAFPAISTGAYRFPMDKAATIAVREARDFLQEHPALEKVIFVCFDNVMLNVYKQVRGEKIK
jgi:O-acetyl-ADP-ribose deacetylase (regulator of RNase III)